MTTETSELKPPSMYSVYFKAVADLNTDALCEAIPFIAGVEADPEWRHALRRDETIKILTAPKDLAETRAMVIANRIQAWVEKTHPVLPRQQNLFYVGVKHD